MLGHILGYVSWAYLLCGCTVDGTDNDHTAGLFQKIPRLGSMVASMPRYIRAR